MDRGRARVYRPATDDSRSGRSPPFVDLGNVKADVLDHCVPGFRSGVFVEAIRASRGRSDPFAGDGVSHPAEGPGVGTGE